jgi:hypothetical protein
VSTAKSDFLLTLKSLEEISIKLGPSGIGSGANRSENNIRLNGIHVIAFAALEDFLRRRAFEVVSWLGKSGVRFEKFPESLRKFILEETIKGINFSISRTDDEDRITMLQLQGLLLESTSNANANFDPSEFVFGKSQSNISTKQIGELLSAFQVPGVLESFTTIASLANMSHLGAPIQTFARLAKNRHRAAHGFGLDYRLQDFITDVRSGLPLCAFTFDTCISQCVFQMAESYSKNQVLSSFQVNTIVLRRFEFDMAVSKWQEIRGNRKIQELAKGKLNPRLKEIRSGTVGKGETTIVRGGAGGIEDWLQPIP